MAIVFGYKASSSYISILIAVNWRKEKEAKEGDMKWPTAVDVNVQTSPLMESSISVFPYLFLKGDMPRSLFVN